MNEGGFDSQRWAMANHRPLQGRVLRARPLAETCGLRQRIIDGAGEHIDGRRWPALLMALGFGISQGMTESEWLLLSRTGTAHLMAISGLHIGLAALFGWLCARGVQYFLPPRCIGAALPLLISWLCAAGYVWLAG